MYLKKDGKEWMIVADNDIWYTSSYLIANYIGVDGDAFTKKIKRNSQADRIKVTQEMKDLLAVNDSTCDTRYLYRVSNILDAIHSYGSTLLSDVCNQLIDELALQDPILPIERITVKIPTNEEIKKVVTEFNSQVTLVELKDRVSQLESKVNELYYPHADRTNTTGISSPAQASQTPKRKRSSGIPF